jgi:hypothetical protein
MRIQITLLSGLLLSGFYLRSQTETQPSLDSLNKQVKGIQNDVDVLKKLKVTGWIQTQFQYVQTRGAANFEGGNFSANSDKRFMIRRGRVKFTYNGKNTQYVMQLNGTERGLNPTEIFAVATDPWIHAFSVSCGVMNRPFGFEIDQSSAVRESPERSRYTQILMPNERDMGAKFIYAAPAKSKLKGLRLDAGFYNGQGVYVPGTSAPAGYAAGTTPVLGVNEFDFQKDFIGRLTYYRNIKDGKINYGVGASHYNGGVVYQNNRSYSDIIENSNGQKQWKAADTSNTVFKGKSAKRMYIGAEGFFSFKTKLGTTTFRGEYITGTQPGTSATSASPFFLNTSTPDTYLRSFSGMYAYFIQRYHKHELAIKYEYYDPNTKVSGKDINSAGNFTGADIRYEQIGCTYTHYTFENVKFMFSYNIVRNEATGLNGFTKDLKDNMLTVRMQYRF